VPPCVGWPAGGSLPYSPFWVTVELELLPPPQALSTSAERIINATASSGRLAARATRPYRDVRSGSLAGATTRLGPISTPLHIAPNLGCARWYQAAASASRSSGR